MSLYTHSFQLLPIPPRSALSWGSESTRARLPNFVDVNEMREFVFHLFVFDFQVMHVSIHIKVGLACLAFLFIISTLIMARRMYERNFWIFRIAKTPSGTIIVPNTMLSFIVIESGFVIIFIALLVELKMFTNQNPIPPDNFILWITLPWCVLIFGPLVAALGTHYATPQTLESLKNEQNRETKARLKSVLSNAFSTNILAILIPTLTCVSVAVPSFIANASYIRAKRQQENWLNEYQFATEFTQEMVIGAQMVWYETLPSLRLTAITFCIWFFWAILCFFLYTTLSLRLIRAIFKEVKKTKREEMLFIATRTQQDYQNKSKNPIKPLENVGDCMEMNIRHSARLPSITEEARETDTMQFDLQNAIDYDTYEFDQLCDSLQVPNGVPQDKNRSKSRSSFTLENENQKSSSKVRLPHLVITQEKMEKRKKESMLASIDEQKKELRQAAINIIAQCLAISPGCALMGGIALMLGITIYGSFEQPIQDYTGTYIERFVGIAILFVIYTIIVLGSTCFFCVLFRVYEPIFVKSTNSSRGETESRETMVNRTVEQENS